MAALFIGITARIAIPVENEPNIEVPFFVVTVVNEGISPEDATELIIKPLEAELNAIADLNEMQSFGSLNAATVFVEMMPSADLDDAMTDVREAVDRAKPYFPTSAEEPFINEQSTSDWPVIQVNIIGEGASERALHNLATDIQEDINEIPEVLQANLDGNRAELLEVIIEPSRLDAYELSAEQLMTTFLRNSRLISAGTLDTGTGKVAIKIPSLIDDAKDVAELPVKITGDTVVTLADVATIRYTFEDRTSYALTNGKPSFTLSVFKRANTSIIETSNAVKAVLEPWINRVPSNIEIFYTSDFADYAEQQVTELQGNIVTALVLVMVLVVAAMGLRSGFIVGMSIPTSFLFAIAIVWMMGLTFNFMVIFGLLLGLGMLIDGSIVVTEYADRKMIEGYDRREAYALAAKRMFWPVTASVGTTLMAFLPLLFWPGVAGKFMSYLPITVFTVLSGSLLYALVFGPTIGSLIGKAGNRDERAIESLGHLEEGDPAQLKNITGIYARLLKFCVRHSVLTVVTSFAVIIAIFYTYLAVGKGMIFFNQAEQNFATVNIHARGNLSIEEIYQFVREVDAEVNQVQGIMSTTAETRSGSSTRSKDLIGQVYVQMHETRKRDRSTDEIIEEIRTRTSGLTGVVVEVARMESGPPISKPIQIQFSSDFHELLEPALVHVRNYLESEVDGLRDIDDTLPLPGVEWEIDVDRAQAALFGADTNLVGMAVQLVTNGVKVSEFRPEGADEVVDIRVRFPREDRGIKLLDDMKIATDRGYVPISNFVERRAVRAVGDMQRVDRKPIHMLRSNVATDVLADDKVKEISAWLSTQDIDPRVQVEFRGANEEQEESINFITRAFMFALALMFILLVTQFNSLYQSMIILLAVIMSTAGVLLGLLIMNEPFSAILTGVGVVALAGVVVNNNIVLIDTFNVIRKEEPNIDYVTLIVRTGAQRLRPVFLTTVTTVVGLLPLASNLSIDFVNREVIYGGATSGFWVPLAQAIVFGLSFATALTLVATPAMLAFPYQLKGFSERVRSRFRESRFSAVETVAEAS